MIKHDLESDGDKRYAVFTMEPIDKIQNMIFGDVHYYELLGFEEVSVVGGDVVNHMNSNNSMNPTNQMDSMNPTNQMDSMNPTNQMDSKVDNTITGGARKKEKGGSTNDSKTKKSDSEDSDSEDSDSEDSDSEDSDSESKSKPDSEPSVRESGPSVRTSVTDSKPVSELDSKTESSTVSKEKESNDGHGKTGEKITGFLANIFHGFSKQVETDTRTGVPGSVAQGKDVAEGATDQYKHTEDGKTSLEIVGSDEAVRKKLEEHIERLEKRIKELENGQKPAEEEPVGEEPAGEVSTKEEPVQNTLQKTIESITGVLSPIKIRFRIYKDIIMNQEDFELLCKKQLEDETNMEINDLNKGRTIPQKRKEDESYEEQWFLKDKAIQLSYDNKKSTELLTQYSTWKSGKTSYLSGLFPGSSAKKEPIHEVFYMYASDENELMTPVDFRLFPDEKLITK